MLALTMGSPALPMRGFLGPSGLFHLAFFGVLVPILVIRGRGALAKLRAYPPIVATHLRALVSVLVLAALSLLVARAQGIRLAPARAPRPLDLALGAAALALFVAVAIPVWRRGIVARRPSMYFRMLRTPAEYLAWSAVALAAGVGEEITWRGVQTSLLAPLVGSPWLAALLVAVMFALGHANQNAASIAIVFAFSLCASLLVALTGSLVVPVLLHVAYDLAAGFVVARLCRTMGYEPPPLPAAGTPGTAAPSE